MSDTSQRELLQLPSYRLKPNSVRSTLSSVIMAIGNIKASAGNVPQSVPLAGRQDVALSVILATGLPKMGRVSSATMISLAKAAMAAPLDAPNAKSVLPWIRRAGAYPVRTHSVSTASQMPLVCVCAAVMAKEWSQMDAAVHA